MVDQEAPPEASPAAPDPRAVAPPVRSAKRASSLAKAMAASVELRPGERRLTDVTTRTPGRVIQRIGLARLTTDRLFVATHHLTRGDTIQEIPLASIGDVHLDERSKDQAVVRFDYLGQAGPAVVTLEVHDDGLGTDKSAWPTTRFADGLRAAIERERAVRLGTLPSDAAVPAPFLHSAPAAAGQQRRTSVRELLDRPTTPTGPSDPARILVEAEGLMAARYDREAIGLLGRIPPDAPEAVRANLLTAIAMWNDGLELDAERAIARLLGAHPDDPDVIRASTWLEMILAPQDEAIAAARAWVGQSGREGAADPWARLALSAERPAEVRAAADAVEVYRPAGAALLRGHADLLEGHWGPASDRYAEALALDPTDTTALGDRILALDRAGQSRAAMELALEAVQAKPDEAWRLDLLRRTVERWRAPLRRLAVASSTIAVLCAGEPPGSFGSRAGGVAALVALVALIAWIVVIARCPRAVRAGYGALPGRTRTLLVHTLQGFGLGWLLTFTIAVLGEALRELRLHPEARAAYGFAITLSIVVTIAVIRWWRKRRTWDLRDLSFPWTARTSPADVPAEG